MFPKPFEDLDKWVETRQPQKLEIFRQFRATVLYHFTSSEEASRKARGALKDFELTQYPDYPDRYFLHNPRDVHKFIRFGDVAIREGLSVIDTGLLLLNQFLEANLDQQKIRWSDKRKHSLKKVLNERGEPETALVPVIDVFFASIAYKLMSEYRNWITHRGSPQVITLNNLFNKPLELTEDETRHVRAFTPTMKDLDTFPPELRERVKNTNRQATLDAIRDALSDRFRDALAVLCYPFCPPVKEVINSERTEGGWKISMVDCQVIEGTLFDPADTFLANNPINLGLEERMVCNERLVVYKLPNYLMSVMGIVFVVWKALQKWERALLGYCDRKWP